MVLQEIYILVKHANFPPQYVENLPVWKRRYNIHLLEEEIEAVKKHREKEERKASASRGGKML
jgi:hypothetical protein